MKFIDEFRGMASTRALAERIAAGMPSRPLTFMEVCGTHTMAIARYGLRQLLPPTLRLISGPGCPVCVTDNGYLDHAVALARRSDTIIATFGDMMRVPASTTDLTRCRAAGADIRVVTSTTEALALARAHPDREVVFLGVGFETTTPTIAASIIMARDEGLKNYSVLCAHKVIPPALEALLHMRSQSKPGSGLFQEKPLPAGRQGDLTPIDGFLLPGHVSAIIGSDAYAPLFTNHKIAAAVAGFEPTDILAALADMVEQVSDDQNRGQVSFKNQNRDQTPTITYSRAVTPEGNRKALALMHEIFEPCDAQWRGVGVIPASGLCIRDAFAQYNAAKKFKVTIEPPREHPECRCGEILQGLIEPRACPLFGKGCTPDHPIGACMVSSEGTCAANYKYSSPSD